MYYPKVYNIEMDPHEDLNVGGINLAFGASAYKAIDEYCGIAQEVPNPPAINLTNFPGRLGAGGIS